METKVQTNGAPAESQPNGHSSNGHANLPTVFASAEEIQAALNQTARAAESLIPKETPVLTEEHHV